MRITGYDPAASRDAATGGAFSAAGGDLAGTLPAPTVVAINGVVITGVPSPGATIIGTGPATAQWAPCGHVTVYWPLLTLSNQVACTCGHVTVYWPLLTLSNQVA